MELAIRKYNLIQKLTKITDEHLIAHIERILDSDITTAQKEELDIRIENFEKDPESALDWDSFKEKW